MLKQILPKDLKVNDNFFLSDEITLLTVSCICPPYGYYHGVFWHSSLFLVETITGYLFILPPDEFILVSS